MVSNKKRKKRSNTSISLGLILLLIGFIFGIYLSPTIESAIPQRILTRLGIKRPERISQVKTVSHRGSINKGTIRKEKVEEREVGKYTLQIAVFSDIESALGLADTLSTRGYTPYIQISNNSDSTMYLLRLGFWTSKGQANNFANTFETKEEMRSSVVQIK